MYVVCIMDFTFLQILVCHFNHKQTADCLLIYVHSIVNFYITILWLTMWRSRQENFPRPTNGGAKAAFNKRDRGIRKCIESGVKEIDTLASIFKVFKIGTYILLSSTWIFCICMSIRRRRKMNTCILYVRLRPE